MARQLLLVFLTAVLLAPATAHARKPYGDPTLYAHPSPTCAGATDTSAPTAGTARQVIMTGKNKGNVKLDVEVVGGTANTRYGVYFWQVNASGCVSRTPVGDIQTDGSGDGPDLGAVVPIVSGATGSFVQVVNESNTSEQLATVAAAFQ